MNPLHVLPHPQRDYVAVSPALSAARIMVAGRIAARRGLPV
jgi:hypothetical protein